MKRKNRLQGQSDGLIPASDSEEAFALHRAALEWTLHAPITIRGEQDIQSKGRWDSELKPYKHQVQNLITFCRRAPAALLADDVGLGKTISAGLILAELMERRRVSRVLVLAPKLLLPQWEEEMWSKFRINVKAVAGAAVVDEAHKSNDGIVTTYHTAREHLEELKRCDFDMLILDEAHKLRNLHGANQPPRMAEEIHHALSSRWFKFVLMLTATPIQNRLWDLYSLLDLLTAAKGHPNPLGTPTDFKYWYLRDAQGTELVEDYRADFRERIAEYIVRTRRADTRLAFPEREVELRKVKPTPDELRLMKLVGKLLSENRLNGLVQSSIGQALMSSPRALAEQLGRMKKRGNARGEALSKIRQIVERGAKSAKLDGLAKLIDELKKERPTDWRVVVFTGRKDTLAMIGEDIERRGISVGFIQGGRPESNQRAVLDFRSEPPRVHVLVSTDAGAEGVNLQAANVLVNYDLPWNPMLLEQRIGRIQRLASKHAVVTVLNLVLAGSVEEKVVARLTRKLMAVSDSIGDLEGILEATGEAGNQKGDFADTIRDLVLKSLKGMDVAQATAAVEESIKEGSELFDRQREEVEKNLGKLDLLHGSGPKVPDIKPLEPSVQAPDFVRRALAAQGARMTALGDDVWRVEEPGTSPYRMTMTERRFEEDADSLGEGRPRTFVPGKPHFERLAQAWTMRGGALVRDRTVTDEDDLARLVAAAHEDCEYLKVHEVTLDGVEEGFRGEITVRASKSVSHDRLEKLIDLPVKIGPEIELAPEIPEERLQTREFQFHDVASVEVMEEAIRSEADLAKFSDFYEARLNGELQRVQELSEEALSPKERRTITDRLTPSQASRPVAARGIQFARVAFTAQLTINDQGPYTASYTFTPGSVEEPIPEPTTPWFTCEESGVKAPESAKGQCEVSDKLILRHLVERCAITSRTALSRFLVTCSISNRRVLETESYSCPITGQRIASDLEATCAVSDIAVSPTELVVCEVTGAKVLPRHLTESEVTGRGFREDETTTSVLSGRTGHQSEMVTSVDPQGPIAKDEAEASDLSGRFVAKGRLASSARSPGRRALEDEFVTCALSNERVLPDEVVACPVTGGIAQPEFMARCEITEELVFPEALEPSADSQKRFRRDEGVASVISGLRAHRSEMLDSVEPEGPILKKEAAKSDLSHKVAAVARLHTSDLEPYRRGLASEMVTCRVSGRRVLFDETVAAPDGEGWVIAENLVSCEFSEQKLLPEQSATSELSQKRYAFSERETSVHSGRTGHRSEFVVSTYPEGPIAHDEAGTSWVSGRITAREFLVTSAVPPHRKGLPDEMLYSALSNQPCLPGEEVRCAVTEVPLLPDEPVRCSFTGAAVAPGEASESQISGQTCRNDQMQTSVLSGRKGHATEFVNSKDPEGPIAKDEAGISEISGRHAALERLVSSAGPSGKRGLESELETCAKSGARFLPEEIGTSSVSGLRFDARLLVPSKASRKLALQEEMRVCEVTGAHYLPSEVATSDFSGKLVDRRMLEPSAASGRRALRNELITCAESEARLMPDEIVFCAASGTPVDSRLAQICAITGRNARPSQMKTVEGESYIDDAISRSEAGDQLVNECPFFMREYLTLRMRKCSLTGAFVHESLVEDEVLAALRVMLDGWKFKGTTEIPTASLPSLGVPPEWRKGAKRITSFQVQPGGAAIIVIERKGFLGLGGTKVNAALLTNEGTGALVGKPLEGKRESGRWAAVS